jgi:hypothetical protein
MMKTEENRGKRRRDGRGRDLVVRSQASSSYHRHHHLHLAGRIWMWGSKGGGWF